MALSKSVLLDDVRKTFREPKGGADVHAVDGVSFEIAPGELVTLLGPSGCGKTTVLRMVAGFEIPTGGRIAIGGTDVTSLPPNKRDTAMVFQSYGLFPHMNVGDNIAYGLKLRGVPAGERAKKADEFLALVGLEGKGDRSPSQLSGGQQQRVALARALIVGPSVLLLDEPLSNLDALLREQMRVEIRRIQKTLNITAIYVTHDRTEAMSLSDRIIVMRSGKIAQIGPPPEIYANPASVFVAGFIGKAAFFQATVQDIGDACRVEVNGHSLAIPRWSPELRAGDRARVMCRPESLTFLPAGQGVLDGRVTTNIYLGNTLESYIATEIGEILVQVDNPAGKTIPAEGEGVSIAIRPELSKALVDDEEDR
ncbi:MAG: ABC transporter ATP-binding protein [Planctomycetaceae bacterium]|nr:ABC transporter ATP-binding protein [Planctomycetaceae bacterium]